MLKVVADLVAVGAQATGFFIWPIVEFGRGHTKIWTVPVAIFLVSAGWWENYVDRKSPISFIKNLGRIKDRLKKTRYFVYSFISILKILFFFSASLLFLYFNGVSIGEFQHYWMPQQVSYLIFDIFQDPSFRSSKVPSSRIPSM